jgi:hypothetical protein
VRALGWVGENGNGLLGLALVAFGVYRLWCPGGAALLVGAVLLLVYVVRELSL